MAKRKTPATDEAAPAAAPQEYTVLARRYRPQQFAALVGQEAVARALVNALESNRVAHAYLFTGARGVGKTSTARILAKALNCERGPTATPCDECDICRSIAAGEDVDVLEIDGASNRGIDEVRELRRNANFRPSRSRYKIYIIDEVHMLTKEAFNALLKTLEEPPAHVKFIFATTEVQKIPVTILSRCQRFDFAGIGTRKIVERLREVVAAERMEADDEALEWVARRAAGSMRDAQSLLDQLLAFGGESAERRLTLEQVHRLLGTANDDRVVALASAVLERDAGQALDLLGRAADEGVQLGELLDQLIDYWRDLMVVSCAGLEGRELSVSAKHRDTLGRQAQSRPTDTLLAGLDILSATKARLRGSHHGRVLVEMALVRLSRLEDLVPLTQFAQWLNGGDAGTPKTPVTRQSADTETRASGNTTAPVAAVPRPRTPASSTAPLTETNLAEVWSQVLGQLGPIHAGHLGKAAVPALAGPSSLVVRFPADYNADCEYCREPSRAARAEEALRKLTGQAWGLRFEAAPGHSPAPAAAKGGEADPSPSRFRRHRAEAMQVPLIKRAIEQLDAQIVHVDEGFGAAPPAPAERNQIEADREES
jgi:DNA polymerase-3 subunit gamma/tau